MHGLKLQGNNIFRYFATFKNFKRTPIYSKEMMNQVFGLEIYLERKHVVLDSGILYDNYAFVMF